MRGSFSVGEETGIRPVKRPSLIGVDHSLNEFRIHAIANLQLRVDIRQESDNQLLLIGKFHF
ncbi:hypothetical protein D3C78_1858180 [compost metagenome]